MNLLKKTACLALCICLICGLSGTAFAADSIDPRTLAMVNKPGIVLVQTVWTADITWHEFSFRSDFEQDLVAAIELLVLEGAIPNTEEAMYSAMVQLMIGNMEYYAFSTGNVFSETTSTASVGTGFIVTPDGYMVTNAHVVHTDEEDLYMQFAMTALNEYAVTAAESFAAEMRRLGYQMTQEEWEGIANAFYGLLAQSMEVNNLKTSYICYMGNVTPGSDVSAKGVQLDLRKIGEPIPGKDIAILKMDKTNLPTVTIGDDTQLRTGDRVYAMGYPAVATLTEGWPKKAADTWASAYRVSGTFITVASANTVMSFSTKKDEAPLSAADCENLCPSVLKPSMHTNKDPGTALLESYTTRVISFFIAPLISITGSPSINLLSSIITLR
jgi:hypothetical protein